MSKQNKRYTVITGASSGIGAATAKAFAERGHNLILIARRTERLNALKEEILAAHPALDIVIKTSDLSSVENVTQVYDTIKALPIGTWINNAGFGSYGAVGTSDLDKIRQMLHLNIEALTVFSTLFVRDFAEIEDTQLINISSVGGYTIVPTAVTYCATKFYVSAFTEGLAHELIARGAKLRAKLLAPAATQTEFGAVANNNAAYDYDKVFGTYHTSNQMAEFLLALYDSDQTIGIVDRETFAFRLCLPQFPYAGGSAHNQNVVDE